MESESFVDISFYVFLIFFKVKILSVCFGDCSEGGAHH